MINMPHNPNELIAIVDKNDKVISKSIRKDIHLNGKLHREASVLIVNSRNQILLQKRKDNGRLDYSASGHFPYNQDYLEAAVRETKEELGLKLDKSKFSKMGKRRIKTIISKSVINNRFICLFEVKGDYKIKDMFIDKGEVTNVRYYSIPELKRLVKDRKRRRGFVDMLEFYLKKKKLL